MAQPQNLYTLADRLRLDRRVFYMAARTAMWGAHKKNGAWFFNSPSLEDYTMSARLAAIRAGTYVHGKRGRPRVQSVAV